MKNLFSFSLLIISALMVSCTSTEDNMSAEMQGFINDLDGTPHDVENALHEFGGDDLINEEIQELELKEAEVLEMHKDGKDDECYKFKAKASNNNEEKVYEICWHGRQVKSLDIEESVH